MASVGSVWPICIICKNEAKNPILVTDKGANTINLASKQGKTDISAERGSPIHSKCRKHYVDKKDIQNKRKLDSSSDEADSIDHGCKVKNDIKFAYFAPKESMSTNGESVETDSSKVEFHEFTQTILDCCEVRCDEWAYIVKGKMFYNKDLPAADCVYHRSCATNFRNNKNIPGIHLKRIKVVGQKMRFDTRHFARPVILLNGQMMKNYQFLN